MNLQVSKISFAGLFIFILLFQQFNVGSEAFGSAIPDTLKPTNSSVSLSDSAIISVSDTIRPDSVVNNNNADEGLKFPVNYQARDSMRVDLVDEVVHLYGEATVDYDDLHLKADYIVIDMNKKELFAEGLPDSLGVMHGTPEFSQGDQQFRSASMKYNFNSRKGKITQVITQEGEGFIHGEVVKKDPENNFYIKKGQYTTCNLDRPHFAITSNRLKVINQNKIITGPAYLTIESVPTPLLLPFGFFPNKKGRSSGIIFPSFGESAERGFYFQNLGYYFGFNDYVNLAVTTDVYSKGSYNINGTSLYRKRYRYSGNLRLSYAYTVNSEPELPDYKTIKDYRIVWTHSQDPKLNPNSTFNASVNAGSSDYYVNTISSVNNFLTNTFQSSINYTRIIPDKPMNFAVQINHWQNTITKEIKITAPEFSFNVTRINPFKKKVMVGQQKWYEKIGTSYLLRGTNSIETIDSLLFTEESLDKFKNGFQHSIPISTSINVLNYYNLTPSFNYTERWYFKTTQYNWNNELQKVDTVEVNKFQTGRDYQASLGLTTRLYGMYLFKNGKVSALRHVLTPAVSLSYRPDYSDEKYGYFKYVQADTTGRQIQYSIFNNTVYGGPSAGQFANLSFSLDNNLEMKVNTKSDTGATEKKVKILESFQLSSNYNMIADSMQLGPIRVNGRTSLAEKVSLNFGGLLNPYAYDNLNRTYYDEYSISADGPLVRLTSANVSMNFSLRPSNKPKEDSRYSKEELDYINNHPEEFVDFDVPYNLTVSYSLGYSKTGDQKALTTQSASFNGDLSLTPQFKIGFNSWYDITNKQFTNFGVNFFRDLHCWEMRLNWIPFGYQESWSFQINVKSSILQDLKLQKKKDYFDN